MKYIGETIKKISPLIGWILAFIAIFFADYTGLIDKLISLFNGEELIWYKEAFNINIAVLIICIILIIFLTCNIMLITFLDRKTMSLRRFNATEILKEVKKVNELKSLTIFGYSISFAEILREHFNGKVSKNLDIILYVTEENYIKEKLIDNHTIEARITEISSRVNQWEKLKDNSKIKSIKINKVASVPVENGLIINNEVIFIDYYQWEKDGEKYKLLKKNIEERDYMRLDKSNTEMFNYIEYQIGLK